MTPEERRSSEFFCGSDCCRAAASVKWTPRMDPKNLTLRDQYSLLYGDSAINWSTYIRNPSELSFSSCHLPGITVGYNHEPRCEDRVQTRGQGSQRSNGAIGFSAGPLLRICQSFAEDRLQIKALRTRHPLPPFRSEVVTRSPLHSFYE